jgi:hypothetical protein
MVSGGGGSQNPSPGLRGLFIREERTHAGFSWAVFTGPFLFSRDSLAVTTFFLSFHSLFLFFLISYLFFSWNTSND